MIHGSTAPRSSFARGVLMPNRTAESRAREMPFRFMFYPGGLPAVSCVLPPAHPCGGAFSPRASRSIRSAAFWMPSARRASIIWLRSSPVEAKERDLVQFGLHGGKPLLQVVHLVRHGDGRHDVEAHVADLAERAPHLLDLRIEGSRQALRDGPPRRPRTRCGRSFRQSERKPVTTQPSSGSSSPA